MPFTEEQRQQILAEGMTEVLCIKCKHQSYLYFPPTMSEAEKAPWLEWCCDRCKES